MTAPFLKWIDMYNCKKQMIKIRQIEGFTPVIGL